MSGSEPQRRSVPTVVLLFRGRAHLAGMDVYVERVWGDIVRLIDDDGGPEVRFKAVDEVIACSAGDAAVEELVLDEGSSMDGANSAKGGRSMLATVHDLEPGL